MIKELLLSLALSAASSLPFLDSPKRVQEAPDFSDDIIFGAGAEYNDNYEEYEAYNDFYSFFLNTSSREQGGTDYQDEIDNDDYLVLYWWDISSATSSCYCDLYFSFADESDANEARALMAQHTLTATYHNCQNDGLSTYTLGNVEYLPNEPGYRYRFEVYLEYEFAVVGTPQNYWISLELAIPATYNLTKNYVNCDIASSPRLPDTFTGSSQLSYYVLMVANAGGYGFTAQSVTQTGGITIRNFNLFDQYNNSGYYASCSFNVDLPLNNCSLSVTAFLPQYTITTTLERCTVSPAIPSSYTGTSFSGDYTFTAVSGYGFNKNYTHWEVTNLFIDSVEFSALLWGSFYSSVTLHLRASGGNSSISVTAIEYDEENYKLGYDEGRADGWDAGYDRGHADGEIAGDSYGVWNWLKQAAITTGEFLNIPLLPGFSIGGLLTALAGLVIIWFFIRGFLFKS